MSTVPSLPITTCPDGAGVNNLPEVPPYVAPSDLCVGDFTLTDPECAALEAQFQESLVAEQLNISGATVNVFKLLGVHEQGRLIDVTGEGEALGSSGDPANAFDALAGAWVSSETGLSVTDPIAPAYIGYDFGIKRTSYGSPANAPGQPNAQHITRIKITQSNTASERVRQVRLERSNGDYRLDSAKVQFSGAGNGSITSFRTGYDSKPGLLMLVALTPTMFSVAFLSSSTEMLGMATVGQQFNSPRGSFTIMPGTNPFAANDSFTAQVELSWYRVDVLQVADVPVVELTSIKASAPARYWRIVPTVFAGATNGSPWVVDKLEMYDYQDTRLDNIQDTLFMENRDRDYANTALSLKVAYSPFDAASDLSKFGFQVPDIYSFSVSFATMVQKLARPIVVGDVLEVPAEMQYDHNLKPVRKFLEVTDVGWSSEGYTAAWKPTIYRFTATQLIPSQETRDILGTADTQKYAVDDPAFFAGIEQIQTAPLTATEANQVEAAMQVPEKGVNTLEVASTSNRHGVPGTYDGVGPYVEDGLPSDGQAYTEGFKLPDVASVADGAYYRLNYDPKLQIPARLYKFSGVKNKWIFVETDRRGIRASHKPSALEIFKQEDKRSLTSKI